MGEKRRRRTNRSLEEWRRLCEELQASGKTKEEFCRSRGIPASSIQKWVRLFGGGKGFIEVGTKPRSVTTVEVVFPDGLVVRIGG